MNECVEEALIRDDLQRFKDINLNQQQIEDFVYMVSCPKTALNTFRES